MKPTLLVLAAGMGSRYGGLKQMDGLGPSGETIIDYSIYDAVQLVRGDIQGRQTSRSGKVCGISKRGCISHTIILIEETGDMTLIKSISGIRGTIGGEAGNALTPLDIVKFTYAFCATLPQRKPDWWTGYLMN